jgi:hypothetical protein
VAKDPPWARRLLLVWGRDSYVEEEAQTADRERSRRGTSPAPGTRWRLADGGPEGIETAFAH